MGGEVKIEKKRKKKPEKDSGKKRAVGPDSKKEENKRIEKS